MPSAASEKHGRCQQANCVHDRTMCRNMLQPSPSACSRTALQLVRKTRQTCCLAARPPQWSARPDPSPLPPLRPPASATATQHDQAGGPAARAGCAQDKVSLVSAAPAQHTLQCRPQQFDIHETFQNSMRRGWASHPSTAWSCSWMSGCGSRCTAHTGCRRIECRLLRDGMCPRRPAEHSGKGERLRARLPCCPTHVRGPRKQIVTTLPYLEQCSGLAAGTLQQA